MADAAILAEWVVDVGRRDARSRVAHLLCEMAVRSGVAPARGEIFFPFPVTQAQLGDATGMTAVHVNRTIQGLRRDGLADVRNNAYIYDWEALATAGDFDPAYLHLHVQPQRPLALATVNSRGTSAERRAS